MLPLGRKPNSCSLEINADNFQISLIHGNNELNCTLKDLHSCHHCHGKNKLIQYACIITYYSKCSLKNIFLTIFIIYSSCILKPNITFSCIYKNTPCIH